MIALCVDDETLLLEDMKRTVAKSPDIMEVAAFDDAIDALDWAVDHSFDIAFLDIRMPVMSGVELAGLLRRIRPDLPVVFCTGYQEYALEAFQIHANGYLLKPVRLNKVQEEIDHIKQMGGFLNTAAAEQPADSKQPVKRNGYLLTVRPYGAFSVTDRNGRAVPFSRNKEKELFAALVHQEGKEISADSLCDLLWEDNERMYEKNKQYIYTLFSHLRSTLRQVGAEALLRKEADGYSLDMTRICVDQDGKGSLPYMEDFSWAGK